MLAEKALRSCFAQPPGDRTLFLAAVNMVHNRRSQGKAACKLHAA